MADCKSCEYETMCTMPDFVRNDLKNCKVYEPKKNRTNADRIRAMDDAELAKFLDATVHTSAENLFSCDERKCTECENCYLEWLQSEAE